MFNPKFSVFGSAFSCMFKNTFKQYVRDMSNITVGFSISDQVSVVEKSPLPKKEKSPLPTAPIKTTINFSRLDPVVYADAASVWVIMPFRFWRCLAVSDGATVAVACSL